MAGNKGFKNMAKSGLKALRARIDRAVRRQQADRRSGSSPRPDRPPAARPGTGDGKKGSG